MGPEATAQDVKGPRTTRLPGPGVRVGTLWATPDTEWGAGAAAGTSEHPGLPQPRGLVLTLGPHLRDLLSQLWLIVAPAVLKTSGRWPSTWLGSQHCHACILLPSPHSWAEALRRRPCLQGGAQESIALLTSYCSPGPEHTFAGGW